MTKRAHLTLQALAATELFAGLPLPALEATAACARAQRLPKGARIFSQGDAGVRAHVVLEGGVRIAQSGSDGAQVVLRFIGPGEMFGTVSLFTDSRYPADAATLAETLEVSWSEVELMDLMGRYPQIAINVIRILGTRLQEVQNRLREIATQRAERRVAHALSRLCRQAGRNTRNGTEITFALRRKDIADIAGITLHTASRILTAWERAGLLSSHRQRLVIRRPSEILRIAEDDAA
jgi:CRP-like cAMP-binding protein